MTSSSESIVQLFEDKKLVKICAPMVRYSKLQFRTLVRDNGCDLCYTPMILADSFCKSGKARNNEFTTNSGDQPLVAQFAANTVHDFVGAAHLISPYCSGVDLNCGCPQTWAKQLGIGCAMLHNPEIISDLVQQCRNQISKPFAVSVKMRILKDTQKTVEICRRLEQSGVTYLTVHGRTSSQNAGDVNTEALKIIAESVSCPIVANGGVKDLKDCLNLQEATSCKGVMVANGLLTNPTLFAGLDVTTKECIQNWVNICYNSTLNISEYNRIKEETVNSIKPTISERPLNLTFQCFHHHLVFMLEKVLPRSRRRIFNNLQNFKDVLLFLLENFDIRPQLYDLNRFQKNMVLELNYESRDQLYCKLKSNSNNYKECKSDISYNYESDGKYFTSKIKEDSSVDVLDHFENIFL